MGDEISICKAVNYAGSITENSYSGNSNTRIYNYSFNLNVSENVLNNTFPNNIIISNFNDWSLNSLLYGRTSPLRLKYFGKDDENINIYCPSINETCIISFPNGKTQINFDFLNYGEIIDYSNIYIKDGTIFDGSRGYLMDEKNMPCRNAQTDYSFLNVELNVCCIEYEYLKIPEYSIGGHFFTWEKAQGGTALDTCEEFETDTAVVDTTQNISVQFKIQYFVASAPFKNFNLSMAFMFNNESNIFGEYHFNLLGKPDCLGTTDIPNTTCWFTLQNSQMQIMNFNYHSKEQILKFENVIVGEIIAKNGMLFKNRNQLFTREDSCFAKTAKIPFTSASYKSLFCCTKFKKSLPPIDTDELFSTSNTASPKTANPAIKTEPSNDSSTSTTADPSLMSLSLSTVAQEAHTSLSQNGAFTMLLPMLLIIGIIIFILIGSCVTHLFFKKRQTQKKQQLFQNVINKKAEELKFDCGGNNKGNNWITYLESKNLMIDFNTLLGKGSNATVYKARLDASYPSYHFLYKVFNKRVNYVVAAKIPTQFKAPDAQEFICELNSLMTLKGHINILRVLGWTINYETPVLVTELANNNLLNHIQSMHHDNSLKSNLQILWQISRALEYVAENKLIHRDVACRNVLITTENVIKLADFGLCCYCDDETLTFQETSHRRFPIKWLSIEALKSYTFSEKSDVWAFGVLCFELFSCGKVPYTSVLNSELLDFLQKGNRLEKPDNASFSVYDFMMRCWSASAKDRPTFKEITKKIQLLLEKEIYGYLSLVCETV